MAKTKKKPTAKEKAERAQKRKENWENFKKFFGEASTWVAHVFALVILIIAYMTLPAIHNTLSSGGWAVLAGIFLIPIGLIVGLGAIGFTLFDFIRSVTTKKWYHILISVAFIAFLLVIILTFFEVIPVIGV